MTIAVANVFTRPYKDINTNRVAVLSDMANICIAMINLIKVSLVTYECQINCASHRDIAL